MKRHLTLLALFASVGAHADTFTAKTGTVGLHAGAGTGKMLSSHADLAACAAAALKLAKATTYTCKASVVVTLVPAPVPPPAPAPAPVPAPPPPAPAPAPVPAPPPPAPAPPPAPEPVIVPTAGYTMCAAENQQCVIAAPSYVIYGTGTTFSAPKPFTSSPWCNNGSFIDPAYGVVKQCWSKPISATTDTSGSDMSGSMPYIDPLKIPTTVATGSAGFDVRLTTEVAPSSDSGAFRTVCKVAKIKAIDPIVFPGSTTKSHLHTFFGNVAVTENSTTESLLGYGNSTCRGGIANRSAYWVPTMIDTATGTPLIPDDISVYYKSGEFTGDQLTQSIPEGLRIVAGSPMKSTPAGPGDTFSFRYKCIGGPNGSNDQYGSAIPNCDVGAQMWQEIFFPQCWDGVNLDSPDHKSHMSYLVQDQTAPFAKHCPSTHPEIIPQIAFNVIYTQKVKDGALKWRLASDMYSTVGSPGTELEFAL